MFGSESSGFPLFICIFSPTAFCCSWFFDNKRDLSLVIFIKFAIYLARVEESGRLCVLVVCIVLVVGLLMAYL